MKPREWWIVQTLLSYTIGDPVYRIQDDEPDELTKRTCAGIFKVVEKSALDHCEAVLAEANKDCILALEQVQAAYERGLKEREAEHSADRNLYHSSQAKLASITRERDELLERIDPGIDGQRVRFAAKLSKAQNLIWKLRRLAQHGPDCFRAYTDDRCICGLHQIMAEAAELEKK